MIEFQISSVAYESLGQGMSWWWGREVPAERVQVLLVA